MEINKILSSVEEVLSKGMLKKFQSYSGIIAEEITASTRNDTVFNLIDKNIEYCEANDIPSKAEFLKNLKEEWKVIPTNFKTKILAILYIEDRFMKNGITGTLLLKFYYDYKTV